MTVQIKAIYIHVIPCWVHPPSHRHTQGEHSVIRIGCQAGQQTGVVAPSRFIVLGAQFQGDYCVCVFIPVPGPARAHTR